MSASNQTLKILLAQGKLEQALDTLVRLTEQSDDADLRQRVLTLSGQFAALKKQHLTDLLEDKEYRLQWNRIAAAVVDIVDNQQLSESFKLSESSRHWKKWSVLLLVVLLAVAAGYFLWKKPAPAEQPAAETPKKDTTVVATPPVNQPAEKPATGKNNVKIEVKDKAKVGNIITGDSNKIDVKQDFGQ